MKEARPANIRSLLLIALIFSSSAFQAFAYYHPDEGRWLSRDPIGESEFKEFPGGKGPSKDRVVLADTDIEQESSSDEVNLLNEGAPYLFVGNEPVSLQDFLGLCKIELRYKLLGSILSKKYYHAFVVLTWEKGKQTYYRGGPSTVGTVGSTGGGGGWGAIVMNYGDYVANSIDWTPGAPSLTVVDDSAPCFCYHQQLVASVETINKLSAQYHPKGPNSNTAAHRLIYILLGNNPSPPVWAPAWEHSLP